ncbi:GNAT family N-acetyltransferase [Planktotalea sp.]|uniref:GNAT family N-acetyltransferase n=1 Tax=Planktotalea sp. TaxID=2029877 RepID=UPI0025F5D2DE|nr:GNAT family N-acetyltransferase [Planktotalea sp.]
MSDLAIRHATREDTPTLGAIVYAWEQRTQWMHSANDAVEIGRFIETAFDERIILVAGDPVSGYLAFDPKRQRIGGLYANAPGHGIGKALMNKIKEGRDYLWLNTHEPNLAAQKFYKREGFVEVSNEGAEPSNNVPELRMEWRR